MHPIRYKFVVLRHYTTTLDLLQIFTNMKSGEGLRTARGQCHPPICAGSLWGSVSTPFLCPVVLSFSKLTEWVSPYEPSYGSSNYLLQICSVVWRVSKGDLATNFYHRKVNLLQRLAPPLHGGGGSAPIEEVNATGSAYAQPTCAGVGTQGNPADIAIPIIHFFHLHTYARLISSPVNAILFLLRLGTVGNPSSFASCLSSSMYAPCPHGLYSILGRLDCLRPLLCSLYHAVSAGPKPSS